MKKILSYFFVTALLGLMGNVFAEDNLPSAYSPNNTDNSNNLVQSWINAGKPYEQAKRALITNGKILIERTLPGIISSPLTLDNFLSMEIADSTCAMRIVVPAFKVADMSGADCWVAKNPNHLAGQANDEPNTVSGLAASVNPVKAMQYVQPVKPLYTKGYTFDEHFNSVNFYIHEHQSFEDSLIQSSQLLADEKGLFMNRLLSPMGHSSLPIRLPVIQKNNQGTQMLVARAISNNRPGIKNSLGICIYSLHGNANRSAEALTCFADVNPKTYTSKYVDQYLEVLDSIRMGP